jgi:hypothetical protein
MPARTPAMTAMTAMTLDHLSGTSTGRTDARRSFVEAQQGGKFERAAPTARALRRRIFARAAHRQAAASGPRHNEVCVVPRLHQQVRRFTDD